MSTAFLFHDTEMKGLLSVFPEAQNAVNYKIIRAIFYIFEDPLLCSALRIWVKIKKR